MFDFDELEQQEDLAPPAPLTEAAANGGQILREKVEGKGGDHQLDEDCKA